MIAGEEAGNLLVHDPGDLARKRKRRRSEEGEGGRAECFIKSRDRKKKRQAVP